MSAFEKLDRMVSNTIDSVNAIRFVLTPMDTQPNERPKPDANRAVIEGKGIFEYNSTRHGIELGVRKSYKEANDLRALQVGREPNISIDRKYFPTLNLEPRQGDIIEFPTKPDLPKMEVVNTERDGLSRLVVRFAQQGNQV